MITERFRVYPGKEAAHTLAEPERLTPNVEVQTIQAQDRAAFWREWKQQAMKSTIRGSLLLYI